MRAIIPILAITLLSCGCDRDSAGTGTAGPAGPPAPTAASLLQPFEGAWRFDAEKTLALWEREGMPAGQVAQARSLNKLMPLHSGLTVRGNAAELAGPPNPAGRYDFFALHPHFDSVCGRAWHHEDRNDPGDTSKCFVRFRTRGADLHLSVRMFDGAPGLNDPDLMNPPPTAHPAECGADVATTPPWSPWMTYVFTRG